MFRTLSRSQLLADGIVAAVFLLLGLLPTATAGAAIDSLILGVFAVALGFRRVAPWLALSVAWVGAALQMLLRTQAPGFADFAVLGILFCTAAYGGRRVRWLGLASAVVGSFVAATYLVVAPGSAFGFTPSLAENFHAFLAALLGLLALLGLSWTLGLLSRTRRRARESRRAQALAERDVVIEQERSRIARDMHDVVAHSLAVVIAQADGARYARSNNPEAVDVALTTISTTAREALGDVRILLGQLRHNEGQAPQPVLADLGPLLEQFGDSGLTVHRQETGIARPLPTGQQLAVYRITQEALTNALRHGDRTQPVELLFAWTESALTVIIRSALPTHTRGASPEGHGLVGIRERAILAGGSSSAGVDGNQWVVGTVLPVGMPT
jgi:signal transduction histidine kinase